MESTRNLLKQLKDDNKELQSALRSKASSRASSVLFDEHLAERNSDALEERLEANERIIEHLREERASLSNDHRDLQKKLSTTTKVRPPAGMSDQ